MAKKRTDSDTFTNPLYDDLLTFFHRNVDGIIADHFGRRWDGDDIRTVPTEYRMEIPDCPDPQVLKLVWQLSLTKRVADRSGSYAHGKTVRAGVVDLSVQFTVPKLRWNPGAERSEVVEKSLKLRLICRPVLKSVASTIRILNELRDRNPDVYKDSSEGFGVLTTNPEPGDIIEDQGYEFFCFDEEDFVDEELRT